MTNTDPSTQFVLAEARMRMFQEIGMYDFQQQCALKAVHAREVARHAAQERIRQLEPPDLALLSNLHRAFSLLLPAEDAATETLAEARRRGVAI